VKLQIFLVALEEVQEYLDKYQEKVKFIFQNNNQTSNNPSRSFVLIIDVA